MKKVAILLENLFDEKEVIYPYFRLLENYEVDLVGTEANTEYESKSGLKMKSDICSTDALKEDYAAVFIPGGFSPDFMRRCENTVKLVKKFDEEKKPIAAICHGGWMLASAADLKGKKATSFIAIKDDMENAGANWVDEANVVDGHLLTARTPDDLAGMLLKFIEMIEGK